MKNLSKPQNSVFYSLSPILYFSKFMGILPLSYEESDGYLRAEWSWLGALHTSAMIVLFIASKLFTGHVFSSLEGDDKKPNKTTVDKEDAPGGYIVSFISTYVRTTLQIVILLVSLFALRRLPEVLRKLQDVNLQKDEGHVIHESQKVMHLSVLSVIVAIALTLGLTGICLPLLQLSTKIPLKVQAAFALEDSVKLMIFTEEMQFINLCILLWRRFTSLNDSLLKLPVSYGKQPKKLQSLQLLEPIGSWTNPGKSGSRRKVKAPPSTRSELKEPPSEPLSEVLSYVSDCHRQLSDVMEDLNSIYQVQLVLSLFDSVLVIISNAYLSLYLLKRALRDDEMLLLIPVSLWCFHHIVRVTILCVVPSITTDQALKTRPLAERINCRSLDTDSREELRILTNHIAARNLSFCICGLFSLDVKLLLSVGVAVATYIIVLLQFNASM